MMPSWIILTFYNFLTTISTPLLETCDLILMGHYYSSTEIAGLGLATSFFSLLVSPFNFLRMGTTGMVSNLVSKNEKQKIKSVVLFGIITAIIIALTIVSLFPWLLSFYFDVSKASTEVRSLSSQYLNMRYWALPFTLVFIAIQGFFLGEGNSKEVFISTVLLNVINISLNFIFVSVFKLGISGLGLASTIAQISALLYLISKMKLNLLSHMASIKSEIKQSLFPYLKKQSPLFIRTLLLISVINSLTIFSSRLGEIELAIHTVAIQLCFWASYFVDALAIAAETTIGQAQSIREKKILSHKFVIRGLLLGSITTALYFLFDQTFLEIISGGKVAYQSFEDIRPYYVLYPIIGSFCFLYDGIFIGFEDFKAMFLSVLLGTIGFFTVSFLFYRTLPNLWIAYLIFIGARGVFLGASLLLKKEEKRFQPK